LIAKARGYTGRGQDPKPTEIQWTEKMLWARWGARRIRRRDATEQQNALAGEKRTKNTDMLGLKENKKNTGKEKRESQAKDGGWRKNAGGSGGISAVAAAKKDAQ
jgi:hypothetical protein